MEPTYIGAYWGDRAESAAQCAARLDACLSALRDVDETFKAWYRQGRSVPDAKDRVSLEEGSLIKLLSSAHNRRDSDGETIRELGFSLGLWNGSEAAVRLIAKLGSSHTKPSGMNHLVLRLPPIAEAPSLYQPATVRAAIEAIISSWTPDWGTWSSSTLRAAQGAPPRAPILGWITFLSDRRHVDSTLNEVSVEKTLNGSFLTLAGGALATAVDIAHIRARIAETTDLQPTP